MDALKGLSSQVNWREYDRVMEQIFYNKFGKLFEEKMDGFEKTKKDLKQNVKRIMDDPKAMATPARRPKPAILLAKRVNELKELQNTAKKVDREKEQIEREKKVQKNREEQLKERAERAKKEREDRAKKVQKNFQMKEEERKEREELVRARLAEQNKFADEQRKIGTPKCERTPAKMFKNIFKSSMALTTPTRTPKAAILLARPINDTEALQNTAKKVDREKEQIERDKKVQKNLEEQRESEEGAERDKMVQENREEQRESEEGAERDKIAQENREEGAERKEHEGLVRAHLNDSYEHQKHTNEEDELVKMKPRMDSNEEDEVVEMTELDEEISAYEMTKDKIPLPSTEDNYNVDDLSSADETDPEDSPRKQIPKWAEKVNLKQHIGALQRVHALEKIERYFGRIEQPAVDDFFKNFKKKYPKRRSSSALWDSPMSDPTPGFGRFQKMFQKSS